MTSLFFLSLLFAFPLFASPSSFVSWPYIDAPIHEIYGWERVEKANPDDVVQMLVAIKQQNEDKMEQILREVSEPSSPRYGQWLSMRQVGEIIRPSASSLKAVKVWLSQLRAFDIQFTPNENWVHFKALVRHLEAAFPSSSYHLFQHPHRTSSSTIIRSVGPFRISADVAEHIDILHGVNDFPPSRRLPLSLSSSVPHAADWTFRPRGGDCTLSVDITYPNTLSPPLTFEVLIVQQAGDPIDKQFPVAAVPHVSSGNSTVYTLSVGGLMNGNANVSLRIQTSSGFSNWRVYGSLVRLSPWVTAALARDLYDIPYGLVSVDPNNSQSVAEFDGQFYSPSDLNKFTQLMGLPSSPVVVVGSNDPTNPGVESTLDIQWIQTTGANVTTTFWYVASGFLEEWLSEVSADPNPPLVHSISYGEPESLILQNSINRMNSEFQQLGARGLSVISTSGDIGVSDGFVRGCDSDTPDYPSASPYTTSLGATAIARDYVSPICTGQSVDDSPLFCPYDMEIPCAADTGQGFTTGGGFSYKSKQPWYQQQVVDQYLQTAPLPPSSWFYSDGRAYNDVTALGSEILIIYDGQFVVTGGTSASGPIFAGVLALLNDVRLQNGKSSLGFVNPFLYSVAVDSRYVGAFNPITIGDNKCKELDANGVASCCQYGFDSAATTWDPLNGLGSPNFQVLKRAVEDLP